MKPHPHSFQNFNTMATEGIFDVELNQSLRKHIERRIYLPATGGNRTALVGAFQFVDVLALLCNGADNSL